MSKKLYVGNLPYTATEDQLKDLFAPVVPSSIRVITDRVTGRSKGFGFVEIESDDEAQKAIDAVNGKEFESRTLVVTEARPEKPREGGGGYGGGGGGGGYGGGGGGRGGRGGGGGGFGGGGGGRGGRGGFGGGGGGRGGRGGGSTGGGGSSTGGGGDYNGNRW